MNISYKKKSVPDQSFTHSNSYTYKYILNGFWEKVKIKERIWWKFLVVIQLMWDKIKKKSKFLYNEVETNQKRYYLENMDVFEKMSAWKIIFCNLYKGIDKKKVLV